VTRSHSCHRERRQHKNTGRAWTQEGSGHRVDTEVTTMPHGILGEYTTDTLALRPQIERNGGNPKGEWMGKNLKEYSQKG